MIFGTDHDGHHWALYARGNNLYAKRLDTGTTRTVLTARDAIDTYGPLVFTPTKPNNENTAHDAFLDTLDLVSTDPETASIEQVTEITAYLHALLHTQRGHP